MSGREHPIFRSVLLLRTWWTKAMQVNNHPDPGADNTANNMVCYVEYNVTKNKYKSSPSLDSFVEGEYSGRDIITELVDNKTVHKDDVKELIDCFETVKKGNLFNRHLHVRLKIIEKKQYELFLLNFCRIDTRAGDDAEILIFFYEVQKEYGSLINETERASDRAPTALNNPAAFDDVVDKLLVGETDVNQLQTVNELFGLEQGSGLQRLNYYNSNRRTSIRRLQVIVSEMEKAISKGQFDIYFQPKCLLETGEIIGAEALVRWFHPERGMVSPIDFVPVFEKCGLIYKLDSFVWKRTCETLRDLIENDYPVVPISMNVSRLDLAQPDVYGTLTESVERYNIPTQLLSLEITESAYNQRTEDEKAALKNLQSYGFKLELDDFGSAYASLNFLCETNIDVLKLDLRSIDGFSENDERQKKIISSIGFLANQMEIPTVVEGIETGQQKDFLKDSGFAYGQGYYFYKPMPINEFVDTLLENAKRFSN